MIELAQLEVGCAKVDVTPPVGTTMDGFASRTRASEGIHDRLFVRAVVLRAGAGSVALVSGDVCWFTDDVVREAKGAAKAHGIGEVMVGATHNHSGPLVADFLVGPTALGTQYLRGLPGHVREAVQSAAERVKPATVFLGRGTASLSVNRRGASGQTDQDVTSVIFKDLGAKPIGGVLGYACHPTVLGEENLQISGDYPGLCSDIIEARYGGGFVSAFYNGACADVNPKTCVGYDCRGTFSDMREMARAVSKAATEDSEFREIQNLQGIRFEKSSVGPVGPFGLEFELSALALGDVVVLGVPGELFASTGLWLKSHSAASDLLIACYTNGYVGYIPPEDAFQHQDYETKEVCWVDKEAEMIVREDALALVQRVLGT